MTLVAEHVSIPGPRNLYVTWVQRPHAGCTAPGTPAPPMLGPDPQVTHSSVRPQLDVGTGSKQPGDTRPQVPVGQLLRFKEVGEGGGQS